MGFLQRFLDGFSGKSRKRLPIEMALLGAPEHLVSEVRRMSDVEQEEAFLRFVEGKHACVLDWKARRDDIYAGLQPLLSPEELRLLPLAEQLPADPAGTIAALRQALSGSGRRLVHTESYGDFSVLVLVPKDKEQEFIVSVGPWLIEDSS
ncbi:MAG TPA: hypothetical protein VFM44_02410 [Gemmatimonadota bacterium]|nr:hypothetical protein [Gemmatimonadota bacterium]